ncbi:unnamed protein product [Linum trigynum]|uniref:Bet v I/Major latex protein domain-containing protein n=1 Tax=Linum trigynum TaxID=586398 RepID=A0AAV2E3K3_9ROSI
MTKETYGIEYTLSSSADDVWGAIFAATSIYPKFLPDLYEEIRSTRRDGYSQGSIREITYGPDFKLVTTAREELTKVDHGEMTVWCTVVSGEFVSKHYRTFKTVTAVKPREGQEAGEPGCAVTWSCTHTGEAGSMSKEAVIKLVKKTLDGLDTHLQRLRE